MFSIDGESYTPKAKLKFLNSESCQTEPALLCGIDVINIFCIINTASVRIEHFFVTLTFWKISRNGTNCHKYLCTK